MWNLSSLIRDGQSQQGDTSRERKQMGLSFPRMAYNLDFHLKQKESGGRGHWRTTQAPESHPGAALGVGGKATVRGWSPSGTRARPATDWLPPGTEEARQGQRPSGLPPPALGSSDGRPSTRVQEGKVLQAPWPMPPHSIAFVGVLNPTRCPTGSSAKSSLFFLF